MFSGLLLICHGEYTLRERREHWKRELQVIEEEFYSVKTFNEVNKSLLQVVVHGPYTIKGISIEKI